jgi:arabinose-5-phosphate isomerase
MIRTAVLVNLGKDAAMPLSIPERLAYAKQIIRAEADALGLVADRLNQTFLQVIEMILGCPGRVCLTGIGKSADVAQKIAGTLNSTGTRSYVLDVTRAVHGDLGMIAPNDVVIALSHSGESEELVRLIGPLKQMALGLVALTSNGVSTLAKHADIALVIGPLNEVCPLGLAPSTSTTAMIAVGDALAFVLSRIREFNHEDFARYHPAGSLGRKLMKVEAIMRKEKDIRLASCKATVREVFAQSTLRGRRTGAVILTDESNQLRGIFTDSDLARLFELRRDAALDRPIEEVMTKDPITVSVGTRLLDALAILRQCKISELPVVAADGSPVGMIDITDVISLLPAEAEKERVMERAA